MDSLLKKLETLFTSEERSELLRLISITAPLMVEDPIAKTAAATTNAVVAPLIAPGPNLAGAYWKN